MSRAFRRNNRNPTPAASATPATPHPTPMPMIDPSESEVPEASEDSAAAGLVVKDVAELVAVEPAVVDPEAVEPAVEAVASDGSTG